MNKKALTALGSQSPSRPNKGISPNKSDHPNSLNNE